MLLRASVSPPVQRGHMFLRPFPADVGLAGREDLENDCTCLCPPLGPVGLRRWGSAVVHRLRRGPGCS